MDNNFFANPMWREAAEWLIGKKQKVNFHGVDVRIMDEEQAQYLNRIKRHKQIKIAWDNPLDNVGDKIELVTKYLKPYNLMCYVLIGYWSTKEQDMMRINRLRKLGVDPYVMSFMNNDTARIPQDYDYQNRFERWVNHKAIFKTVKFEDYKP